MTPEERYRDLRERSGLWKKKGVIKHHFIRHLKEAVAEAYADAARIADEHNGCTDVKCLSESNCGATITNQLLSRAKEL